MDGVNVVIVGDTIGGCAIMCTIIVGTWFDRRCSGASHSMVCTLRYGMNGVIITVISDTICGCSGLYTLVVGL